MWTNHEDPDDNQLRHACVQVDWILGNFQRAESVVARAALKIDKTYASHVKNKDRGESIESKKRQAAYQPRFTRSQIFDLLVMSELEKEEKIQEVPGHKLTHIDWIKRHCKHLIIYAFTHTSYHAAVAVGRILCTYTAKEVGRVYEIVAYNRALKKSDPECSDAKDALRKSVASRFAIPQQDLFREGACDKLPSSDWRVSLTAESLDRFVSVGSVPEVQWEPGDRPLLRYNEEDPHGDSDIEVARMSIIWRKEYFNRIARAAKLKSFEESVKELKSWWPFPSDAGTGAKKNGNEGGNGKEGGQYNLKEIRDYVASERKRRRRISPGSLAIRVDGIDCATISRSGQEYETTFEADATMVDVVGRDDEGDVVLATYILTYDQPRTEAWTADLPRSQKLLCTFEYDEDDRVRATFTLTNAKQLRSAAVQEYLPSGMASALRPAWLKARIILDFAGKALIAIAVVLATLLYVNMRQSLNNQRTAHELNLAYLQDFSRDIGSAEPGQRLRAISIYREMSPQLAAPLAPIVAEADPMTATNRSVDILTDRLQDPQTRSVAEQSRRQIMSDFRIKEPAYDSKVSVRQVVRGTTPFPGMRHYIIVTTPQGVDFVAGEAGVSGNSWEGFATFGSAGVGGGEKYYVRVIATKTSLSEGPFGGITDAISSDSIPVMREP